VNFLAAQLAVAHLVYVLDLVFPCVDFLFVASPSSVAFPAGKSRPVGASARVRRVCPLRDFSLAASQPGLRVDCLFCSAISCPAAQFLCPISFIGRASRFDPHLRASVGRWPVSGFAQKRGNRYRSARGALRCGAWKSA
jgi:hypothetical protein